MANERRRLIDACKLDILGYLEEFPICDEDKGWNAAINSVFAHVVCAPTVDAVEVVRCGQCKNNPQFPRTDGKHVVWCRKWRCETKDTDFCSYGERRCE